MPENDPDFNELKIEATLLNQKLGTIARECITDHTDQIIKDSIAYNPHEIPPLYLSPNITMDQLVTLKLYMEGEGKELSLKLNQSTANLRNNIIELQDKIIGEDDLDSLNESNKGMYMGLIKLFRSSTVVSIEGITTLLENNLPRVAYPHAKVYEFPNFRLIVPHDYGNHDNLVLLLKSMSDLFIAVGEEGYNYEYFSKPLVLRVNPFIFIKIDFYKEGEQVSISGEIIVQFECQSEIERLEEELNELEQGIVDTVVESQLKDLESKLEPLLTQRDAQVTMYMVSELSEVEEQLIHAAAKLGFVHKKPFKGYRYASVAKILKIQSMF